MLTGTRVLVVEDEALFALEISEAIKRAEGTVVGPFATAAEAGAAVREDRVDVAVLDINLADGQVTPVLEALSARGRPIIVCTGGALPEDLRRRHPELRTLEKPVQTARLLAEIRRARRKG